MSKAQRSLFTPSSFSSLGRNNNNDDNNRHHRHQDAVEDYGDDDGVKNNSDDSNNNNNNSNNRNDANPYNAYWRRVQLPTDDLDNFMWGNEGVPPPMSPSLSKFQKRWSKQSQQEDHVDGSRTDGGSNENTTTDGEDGEQQHYNEANDTNIITSSATTTTKTTNNEQNNDNILSALGAVLPPPPCPSPPSSPKHDKIILQDVVWKQRSGFGKYSLGILNNEWEQRRVVLFESGVLKYYANSNYALEESLATTTISNEKKNHESEQQPPILPRGEIYLRSSAGSGGNGSKGAKARSRITIHARQRRQHQQEHGPTPFEIDIKRKNTTTTSITTTTKKKVWRFCFISVDSQMEWLSALKSMVVEPRGGGIEDGEDHDLEKDGYDNDADDDDDSDTEDSDDDDSDFEDSSEGLGANHGFQPGDHIIRWEMLPIVYPIQIHGIVLEAGKNCVIIADFGLASYDAKLAEKGGGGSEGGLTTWSEGGGKDDDSHDIIMQAWEKIKPKEKKRLNVNVVTDPKEIRKWSKISYGDQAETENKKKKKGFFKKWNSSKSPKNSSRKKRSALDETVKTNDDEDASGSRAEEKDTENNQLTDDHGGSEKLHGNIDETAPINNNSGGDDEAQDEYFDGEPEWFRAGYNNSLRKRADSSSSVKSNLCDGQSVFSIDNGQTSSSNELPKSDSAKLVLARTHFILENEDLLPPYHVFYSNSECIAVWCKTGRWSTLQAAVYLVSSSVGFGKSATMLTISVAAAHAILIPALAVGGLAIVGAPLLFLKKSQAQWNKATMRLTEEFWLRAPPDVFVEAIEYWGGVH